MWERGSTSRICSLWDLVAWWLKMRNMYRDFSGSILLGIFVACHHHPPTPPPHFPSFSSLSTFKIKAKMFDNSRFFPPPYPRDIRYTTLKGLEKNLLWIERSFQLVQNSFEWTNRSRAMVILCKKDPKRGLTQSDKILPIAQESFISNNHTETYGRQTEGEKY